MFANFKTAMRAPGVAVSLLCFGFGSALVRCEELSDDRRELIRMFVITQGAEPKLIQGFENRAITSMIDGLKNEKDVQRRTDLLQAISKAIKLSDIIDSGTASAAKGVIYQSLVASAPIERIDAAKLIASSEKDSGLDRLMPLLVDSNESVRVVAADLFGEYGSEARIVQMSEVLKERAKGLTAEEIKRDYLFRHGYAAIEKLKQRWQQPSVRGSEARGMQNVAVPSGHSPAPTSTAAHIAVPAIERKTSAWPWIGGIAALLVIVALVFKRRVAGCENNMKKRRGDNS